MTTIGVTGHQNLENRLREQGAAHSEADAWWWVEHAFRTFLTQQHRPVTVVSSLAIGADQRLSQLAIECGSDISVVIPAQHLITTFRTDKDRSAFKALLLQARSIEELSHPEPSEQAYFDAGKRVIDRADKVVAVWDGCDAEGLGGTGDAVAYALTEGKEVLQLDPIRRTTHLLLKGM